MGDGSAEPAPGFAEWARTNVYEQRQATAYRVEYELLGNYNRKDRGEKPEPYKFLERRPGHAVTFEPQERALVAHDLGQHRHGAEHLRQQEVVVATQEQRLAADAVGVLAARVQPQQRRDPVNARRHRGNGHRPHPQLPHPPPHRECEEPVEPHPGEDEPGADGGTQEDCDALANDYALYALYALDDVYAKTFAALSAMMLGLGAVIGAQRDADARRQRVARAGGHGPGDDARRAVDHGGRCLRIKGVDRLAIKESY